MGPSPVPDRIRSENGKIARPAYCSIVPVQMNGTRRQPNAEMCMSERKPISARSGAKTTGKATISATNHAGTPNSTIMTRFSVPVMSTSAMPTDTWNSDSRRIRDNGISSLPTSAKGSISGRIAWKRDRSLSPNISMRASPR